MSVQRGAKRPESPRETGFGFAGSPARPAPASAHGRAAGRCGRGGILGLQNVAGRKVVMDSFRQLERDAANHSLDQVRMPSRQISSTSP